MSLTDRQRSDLNVAILDYLSSQGDKYNETIASFLKESAIDSSAVELGKGMLEKKWTSVIRLQKRVMDLESKVESLTAQKSGFGALQTAGSTYSLDSAASLPPTPSNNSDKVLPRPPQRANLTGHRGPVTAVALHPVYSILASGSEDTTIRLWDFETGQYERTLKGHTGTITGLAFDPRGTMLASTSIDMTTKLWDLTTNTCVRTLKGHDHSVSTLAFSIPSAETLWTASRDGTLKAWEVNTGYCTTTLGAAAAAAANASTGAPVWIKTLSLSLDGVYAATGGTDHLITIWHLGRGQIVQTLRGHEHVIETLAFGKKPIEMSMSPRASKADGFESAINPTQTLEGSSEYSYLVSGSRDKTVKLWDPLKGALLMSFSNHENWVRGVVFQTSRYIISVSDDKSIRVFDTRENRCMRTINDAHTHFVSCVAMSTTYPVLVTGSVDRSLSIWNCA